MRPHRLFYRLSSGALLGLSVFALECLLLLNRGAIGLGVNTSGPFAALAQIVRPMLPALLGRVALVYLVAGSISGLLAYVGAHRRGWRRALQAVLFVLTWAGLWGLFIWEHAVLRPALFDDLPGVAAPLEWLVNHGETWHPRGIAGGLGALVLGFAALRLRREEGWRRFEALPLGVALLLFASWPRADWEAPLPTSAHQDAKVGAATHVVLIGVDAFRVDRLRALGAPGNVAPNLDAFLEDATLFTQAYTPIAQTEPAWRSLLTGQWPSRTGVRYPLTPQSRLAPMDTFPAALGRAGWATHFATDCSRFHYEDAMSGFAVRAQPPRGAINFLLEKLRFRGVGVFADNALGAAWLPEFVDNRALAGTHDPLGYTGRLAAQWTKTLHAGPALVAFHATAAHFPGDPSYPFYRRFVPQEEPLSRRLRMHFSPIASQRKGAEWTREGSEALYDELLAQADAQVGLLLNALKREALYDDALIIVFSDHGESFHADRPELAGATPLHGARLGAEENQILLGVKLPGARREAPERIDSLVRLIDVGPTILEAAGLAPIETAEGASFLSALRGQPLAPRRLYAETGVTHAVPEVFDPGHSPGTPRTFSLYRLRPDGVAEVAAEHHASLLAEKDRGAFDGRSWVIDSPRSDGTIQRRCEGPCDDPLLGAWLDEVIAGEDAASPPSLAEER